MAKVAVQTPLDWGQLEAPSGATPSLTSVEPGSWPVSSGWNASVEAFWGSKSGAGLQRYLQSRLSASAVVYPREPLRALKLTPLEDVKVVILGQDPYHGPGQAEGLAFSVAPGVKTPPSLRNIFKELQRDLDLPIPASGSLVRWAEQGVLLLNTCLTVEDGQPAAHAGRGWEALTDALIRSCSEHGAPKAFLLWGAHAQKKSGLINETRHLVLLSNHPSPLSASRGPLPFLGCGHFSATNEWLLRNKNSKIHW